MTVLLLVLAVGVNMLVWAVIGALRCIAAKGARPGPADARRLRPDQVAVLVAAHNEELGVADSVSSALGLVPPGNVFVVSDGSRDATVARAQAAGAVVLDLQPNRGKAGALAAGIDRFGLATRFEVVMLLDADTVPADDYLETGLPLFDDPDVVAVAGDACTAWERGWSPVVGQVLRAYRDRLYVVFQVLLKYGQAARGANCVAIVPGFASMYRTRVLSSIDVAAEGLVIEDFNMTFEVHAKRLGRIAYVPRAATAFTQDPHTLRDYTRQVGRWGLGFWQTVRRHGLHRGRFWISTAAYGFELLTSSVLFAALVPLLLVSATATMLHGPAILSPADVLLGVVAPDYLLTLFVAVHRQRPIYLLLGLAFLPLRVLDAVLCLRSLVRTWSVESNGTWTSPARRAAAGSAPPSSVVEPEIVVLPATSVAGPETVLLSATHASGSETATLYATDTDTEILPLIRTLNAKQLLLVLDRRRGTVPIQRTPDAEPGRVRDHAP